MSRTTCDPTIIIANKTACITPASYTTSGSSVANFTIITTDKTTRPIITRNITIC